MGAIDELYGGKLADFADSMAQEIELAYNAVLAESGKAPLPSSGTDDRRILFIAIARGVVNHLQKKGNAVQVTIPVNPEGKLVKAAVKVRQPA